MRAGDVQYDRIRGVNEFLVEGRRVFTGDQGYSPLGMEKLERSGYWVGRERDFLSLSMID